MKVCRLTGEIPGVSGSGFRHEDVPAPVFAPPDGWQPHIITSDATGVHIELAQSSADANTAPAAPPPAPAA